MGGVGDAPPATNLPQAATAPPVPTLLAAPQSKIPPSTCITCLVVSPLFVTSASQLMVAVAVDRDRRLLLVVLSTSAVEPSVCPT